MSEEILDQQEEQKTNSQFNIEDNSGRAKTTAIFIIILTITNLPLLWAEISYVQAMQDGGQISIEENEFIIGIIGVVQIILNICCIIFCIRWFKRAYTNLSARVPTESTPGWTIGSWFIPIVSLFKPYQIMKEMWIETLTILRNTHSQKYKNPNIFLGSWWLLWIIVSIGANITMQITNRSTDIANHIVAGKIDIVLTILSFPLGILAYLVITKYNKLEDQLNEAELSKMIHSDGKIEVIEESFL